MINGMDLGWPDQFYDFMHLEWAYSITNSEFFFLNNDS